MQTGSSLRQGEICITRTYVKNVWVCKSAKACVWEIIFSDAPTEESELTQKVNVEWTMPQVKQDFILSRQGYFQELM